MSPNVESLNPKVHSVVEAVDMEKKALKLAGADSIICSEEFSCNLTIQELQDPGVKEILLRLTSNRVGNQLYLTPIQASQKTYKDLVLWGLEKGCTLMGLSRDGKPMLNPATQHPITAPR